MIIKGPFVALVGLLVVAGAAFVSGCAIGCSATSAKLAALRPGMSYDETTQIMGCPGAVVTEYGPAVADYAIVEWSGPNSVVFDRTRIEFVDGRLLSYVTEKRGAL